MHSTGHNVDPLADDISGTDKMSVGWPAMMSITGGEIRSEKESEEGKFARIGFLSVFPGVF